MYHEQLSIKTTLILNSTIKEAERTKANKESWRIKQDIIDLFAEMSVVEFFERVTIPFNVNDNDRMVRAKFLGFSSDQIDNDSLKLEMKGERFSVEKTIESIVLDNFGTILRKCFTFYSHLQKLWSDFKINLKLIIIGVKCNLASDKSFHLAIHSPNRLPRLDDNDFMKIKQGSDNIIFYSEVQYQLLGSGFDTNCFD